MSNHLINSLIFTLAFGFFAFNSSNFSINKKSNNNTLTYLDFENKSQQDTTPSHSRSKETYRSNDNGYKIHLVIIDGKVKKLKINGKKIPNNEYEQYAELIEDFRSSNNAPTSPTPSSPTPAAPAPPSPPMPASPHIDMAENQESTSDIIVQELIEDGLITNEERYKIHLSKKKFKVNGKTQDDETHQKYMKLYKKLSGTKMHNKTTYKVNKNSF